MANRILVEVVAVISLAAGGCVALYMKNDTVTGVCFGAIATWLVKNGYNSIKKAEP
uniref:Lipoprotein n=1 Tax=viral metagenome TaxID=1070528 RepID=A0A6H1ZM96_9ZZZZ